MITAMHVLENEIDLLPSRSQLIFEVKSLLRKLMRIYTSIRGIKCNLFLL